MATNILDIEGVGPAYAEKLKFADIDTVEELLEKGASKEGRASIEATTGLTHALVLKWVNHADLFRIKGVAGEYAELLEAAGVDTVVELATRNAQNLTVKMAEVNAEKSLVRRVPTETETTKWVAEAKTMPRVVTH